MLIVKLMGGLGNQMFQLAYAKDISKKTGKKIFVDTTNYINYKVRPFSSNNLKVFEEITILNDSIEAAKYHKYQKIYRIYQKVCKDIFKIERHGLMPQKILMNLGLCYNFDRFYYPYIEKKSKVVSLYGYFQSVRYFDDSITEIKSCMKVAVPSTPAELKIIESIRSNKSIAISMRLGKDYLDSPDLNVCTEGFYIKALSLATKKYPQANIFVFSDKIDDAKKILKGIDNCNYIEGFNDYQSLRIMYNCDHFVISNSSFSWWGAFLGENKEKSIYCPSKWYNGMKNEPDIYFDSMIKVDV